MDSDQFGMGVDKIVIPLIESSWKKISNAKVKCSFGHKFMWKSTKRKNVPQPPHLGSTKATNIFENAICVTRKYETYECNVHSIR